jgi:hypothetical protein
VTSPRADHSTLELNAVLVFLLYLYAFAFDEAWEIGRGANALVILTGLLFLAFVLWNSLTVPQSGECGGIPGDNCDSEAPAVQGGHWPASGGLVGGEQVRLLGRLA